MRTKRKFVRGFSGGQGEGAAALESMLQGLGFRVWGLGFIGFRGFRVRGDLGFF